MISSDGWTITDGGKDCSPEMDVLGAGLSILNGDTTPSAADDTHFGATLIAAPVTHTFTILNEGGSDLVLSGAPAVTLTVGTHFSVTVQPASPVSTTMPTTFQVRFAPLAADAFTDTVNIPNNDPEEDPYTFVIGGEGLKADTTTITSDLPDPSLVGQPYIVTASVTATVGTPSGTINVDDGDGNTPLGTGTVLCTAVADANGA